MLNEQSSCDVIELLEYWADEPPAHVALALRYLGPGKRSKAPVSEEQARQDMEAIAGMTGRPALAIPDHLKEMVRAAEQMKRTHKGI